MANRFEQYKPTANRFTQFVEEEDDGFSVTEMVGNIPGDAIQVAENTYQMLRHPIETGTGIAQMGGSFLEKIGRNLEEFALGEEIAPTPGKEDLADAMMDMMAEDYGSLEAIGQTVEERPVQSFLDILGLATGVGNLPRMAKVGNVARSLEPVNAVVNAIPKAVGAVANSRLPQSLYQGAAKFSTAIPNADRRAMIQTALDEGIMPTDKGAAKIQNRLDILNLEVENMLKADTPLRVSDISQFLSDLQATKGGVRLGAAEDLAVIDKLHTGLMEQVGNRTHITPQEMQRFKVEAYKDINWDARRGTGTPIKEETYKTMARGAKTSLQDAFPEIKEVNEALGRLYELQVPISTSANRIENLNPFGLGPTIFGAVGLGTGGPVGGVASATAAKVLTDPKLRARVAIALNKMKDKDTKWLDNPGNQTEVRLALQFMGRELPDEETVQE
jgi:hypothetical protein